MKLCNKIAKLLEASKVYGLYAVANKGKEEFLVANLNDFPSALKLAKAFKNNIKFEFKGETKHTKWPKGYEAEIRSPKGEITTVVM